MYGLRAPQEAEDLADSAGASAKEGVHLDLKESADF